jgi:uncharacterized protein (DUF2141 family)
MKMMRNRLWMRLFLGGLFVSFIDPPAMAQQATVTVNVSGLHSQKGNIVVCLWNKDKDFPICSETASFKHVTVKAASSTVTATFQNVAPGEYALSAFHDENQDGKINRGFMGRPKEGIAFSGKKPDQSQSDRGRPSFDKEKFTVNGAKTISMSLKYF